MVPEFAILGHPNEGKSSVLSTLTEDDSVTISDIPGETKTCRTFPVVIDDREVIRFTDTPGFQNPRKILYEIKNISQPATEQLQKYVADNFGNVEMRHDCELLSPLLRGAGIIYVADGSRPIRNVDLAEMEILRLTGKPRMALLNCKDAKDSYIEDWKTEFRKHFNSSRIFNAHSATYQERITLLEALKSIEQDWHEPLDYVVQVFKKDWTRRNTRTAELIIDMMTECLCHSCTTSIAEDSDAEAARLKLFQRYTNDVKKMENGYHKRIRTLFKHNIFQVSLPEQSILNEDLFSRQTWQFLGLSKKQLVLAGGTGGAMLAATIDIAAGGASLGLFTSLGGVLGAMGALYGGQSIAQKTKVFGMGGGKLFVQVGPTRNVQFGFILLDRVLLYYSYIINWAHGRRDYQNQVASEQRKSHAQDLQSKSLRRLTAYMKTIQKNGPLLDDDLEKCKELILKQLESISTKE